MIRPKHIRVLVGAKLRAKPGRSALVIAVSSILFGVALAGLTIFHAGIESAERFSESTFHGRHYVMASYTEDASDISNNTAVQQQAKRIYEADIAKKKVAAQRIGIDFDPRTVEEPLLPVSGSTDGEMTLNVSAPSAQQAITEYRTLHPGIGIHELEKLAKPYSATTFLPMQGLDPKDGTLSLMKDGKEVYSSIKNPVDTSDDFMAQAPLRLVSDTVVAPFINKIIQTATDEIPITIPYAAAETLLGLSALDSNKSATERLQRLQYLNDHAIGARFSVCYRNAVSKQQIDQALNDTQGKDSGILYTTPVDNSCTAAKVVEDKRLVAERLQEQKQQQFDQEFGVTTTPIQKKLSFRVVGLVPDDLAGAKTLKSDLVETTRLILRPSWLGQPTITTQAYQSLPRDIQSLFQQGSSTRLQEEDRYLVEFTSVDDAGRFISERSCDRIPGVSCGSQQYPFILQAYGDGGVAFIGIRELINKMAEYVIGGMVVVAILVMIGTFGRIIGEERHEMAIFRALGATRLDITLVYVVYAIVLSLLATVIAVVLAEILAFLAHTLYVHDLTVAMRLTYGELNPELSISLIKVDLASIVLITGTIIVTGIISIGLPLQRAIQRDIIQDLKGE